MARENVYEQCRAIDETRFIKGLLAAAALSGVEAIVTFGDAHQVAFRGLMDKLQERRDNQDPATERMPQFYPGLISNTYGEFDSALLYLQYDGITRPVAPYNHVVEITTTHEFAAHILARFTEQEQSLLTDLAQAFKPEEQLEHLA